MTSWQADLMWRLVCRWFIRECPGDGCPFKGREGSRIRQREKQSHRTVSVEVGFTPWGVLGRPLGVVLSQGKGTKLSHVSAASPSH